MKKRGMGIIEYSLILAMAVIITIAFWGKISNAATYLASLSAAKIKPASTVNPPPVDTSATLIANVKAMIDALDKNSPNYIQKRIDATGSLGELIAAHPELSGALSGLIQELAAKDGNRLSDSDASACVANMSSCSTLMTVTDFSWSTPSAMTSVYNGGKITVSLKYTYNYLNNQGKIVNATLDQGAYIQKEQNANSKGQTYGSFLNTYMDKTYPDSSFTGSAASVQKNVDAYLEGKNCELSKEDSQYISFANHSASKK